MKRPKQTPVPDLRALKKDVDDLFEHLLAFDRATQAPESWVPSVDVSECRDTIVVVVEVPGMSADDLELTLQGRELLISGDRRSPRKPTGAAWLCVERPHGRFRRVVALDCAVDAASAQARLSNGLLVVKLPRVVERRGQGVVIEVKRS